MSLRLVALLVALSAVPSLAAGGSAPKKKDPAEAAYQQARRGYYALKDDPARRKFRHHWLAAVQRFQDVATRHPKSPRASDALFTSAELLSDLSRVSLLDADLKAAVAAYGRVVEQHPKSSLADDAALALAKIHSDRLGQPELAVKALERGAALGRGDRAGEIAALHAALSPGKPALRFGPPEPAKKTAVASAKGAGKARPERKVPEPAVAVRPEEKAPVEEEVKVAPLAEAAVPPTNDAESHSEALSAAFERAMSRNEAPEVQGEESVSVAGVSAGSSPASEATASAPPTSPGVTPEIAPSQVASSPVVSPHGAPSEASSAVASSVPVAAPSVAGVPGSPSESRPSSPSTRLPKVAAHRSDAGVTLAEQLGLKIRRVVIDPGHGGHDSGAIGRKKTQEKDVALAVSKQVAELLRAEGLEVSLTRDDDRFVRLEDRAKFANEAKADLFISIHCNSAPNRKSRGIETYTLNTSADRYSIRLAARENASSERGVSDLQFILADLATKANTEESTRLATRVQSNLVKHLSGKYSGIKDLGTKEALFYVLLGVRMPAILIETSFLSHPEEEKRLGSKSYQRDMAHAIAAGVQDFLDHRGRLAQVN